MLKIQTGLNDVESGVFVTVICLEHGGFRGSCLLAWYPNGIYRPRLNKICWCYVEKFLSFMKSIVYSATEIRTFQSVCTVVCCW